MVFDFLIVAFAGFLGGGLVVTSGGGSFITYPVLLYVGLPTTAANATSSVGLFTGWITSIPNFKHEFVANKKIIRVLLIPALIGAITGSWILTKTPEEVFGFVAPILILFGALALQFRSSIIKWGNHIHIHTHRRRIFAVGVLTFFVCAYSSFFGAGVGILMLACLSLLDVEHLVHNIAIKNAIVIVGNGVAFIYFLIAGLADTQLAIAIAFGAIPGAYLGSKYIHKTSEVLVRRFTVIFGVVASIILFAIRLV